MGSAEILDQTEKCADSFQNPIVLRTQNLYSHVFLACITSLFYVFLLSSGVSRRLLLDRAFPHFFSGVFRSKLLLNATIIIN